jgi:hypothetical protein
VKPFWESSQLLQNRVRYALLHEWDPIGVQEYPGAQDEYDSYVPDVYRMLLSRATEEEILNYLWWLETRHMGLGGERERTETFAKRLLQIRDEVLGSE